ncbi:MAG: hypothetical protein E7454_03310 [Ruminococcaceae bacterium]|nr:hypothetical protein [Oscillospiraceae bacterium]
MKGGEAVGTQIRYELTEAQANLSNDLAIQFKRDIDNTNNGSIETRKRYHTALENRFAKFLASEFRLKNINNISKKHVYAYVGFLQAQGKSAGYLVTELAAIRFWRKHSNCKNKLPENKQLDLEKREVGKYNRGLLDSELTKMIEVAKKGDRRDIVFGVYIAYYFGLRKNELVTVRIWQLEEADANNQLHIPRGKGGRKRDVPVDTHEQSLVLKEILRYAKSKGKKSSDYLFCDNHKHSVKKEKDSITNWMSNHIDEILDPDRKLMVEKGKKARAEGGYGWHSLRHTYAQRTEKRLIACGMSLKQARKEVSERLGHGRPQVLKTYED